MIVQGDISGIQDFVTNVAEGGGGQAKRLRARSFAVQLLCEAAAVRVSVALGWPIDLEHLVMSAAGHFILKGNEPAGSADQLKILHGEMNKWLLEHLNGEVRLALGWSTDHGTELEQFHASREMLNKSQQRPFASVVVANDGRWDFKAMVLRPLDTPCVLCRQQPGTVNEKDSDDGTIRIICKLCDRLRRFGRALTEPARSWLSITEIRANEPPKDHSFEVFGLNASLESRMPNPAAVLACTNLKDHTVGAQDGPFSKKWIRRQLGRSAPVSDSGEVLDFEDLAAKATGDRKLAIMKADGDGMGVYWSELLASLAELSEYGMASGQFDDFSAREINHLIEQAKTSTDPIQHRFRWIYTVYSGGDDLLFIGPWDVVFDFAGEVQRLFANRFGHLGLTISTGIAVAKHNWPVHRMAEMAEELLEMAKRVPARGADQPRNQVAALGEIWKWEDHQAVIEQGRQWANWVNEKQIERGTLRDIYEFSEARWGRRNQGNDITNEIMADARLDYLLTRRISQSRPRRQTVQGQNSSGFEASGSNLQSHIERMKLSFTAPSGAEDRHLSASLNYALLATRSFKGGE
ncbi:MAG: type III-A CRISPR-associated protein Cas10/Csm1 [Schlesneria sp.]